MKYLKDLQNRLPDTNSDGFKILMNLINGKYFIGEKDVIMERNRENLLDYELFFTVSFFDGLVTGKETEVNFLLNYYGLAKKFEPYYITVRDAALVEDPEENDIITELYVYPVISEGVMDFLEKVFQISSLKIQKTKSVLDELLPLPENKLDNKLFLN